MSQEYDNTNSGALFKNDRRHNDRSPMYKGECQVACPHCGATSEHWISAWVKTMRGKTEKFMSLAFNPKDEPQAAKPQAANDDEGWDDDVPF